jgi:hypothetical protein
VTGSAQAAPADKTAAKTKTNDKTANLLKTTTFLIHNISFRNFSVLFRPRGNLINRVSSPNTFFRQIQVKPEADKNARYSTAIHDVEALQWAGEG